MDNHLKYMQLAYYQAQKAFDIMEVPVGAVIVKDDKVIGAGYNKKETYKSPISHAEIEAIQAACKNTNDWRLNGASLYVTAEPCIMCAGAILHARIDKVYFYDFVKNREDNNGTYEAIVERLSSYVTYNDYSVADIYAPSLLVVCNDEVLLFDTETSFRSGNIAPSEYWNSLNIENKKSELREIFRTYLES